MSFLTISGFMFRNRRLMPGIAKPIIFDEIPTKRPHFFFLIAGRKYFTLKK